ncbi:transcription factor FAMA-like [Diospyros lotus]|uniref:transcription factor FAMA-like n=1 Tax=Diospyros lotus TaxID=55363 RepID=UPI0022598055|nr:transcription factor FAMA-like [Diospyros lotus]XP_052208099.1 transcription factor FAMA-like [Diospyros lotus]
MDKEGTYSAALPVNFPVPDYSLDQHQPQFMRPPMMGETSADNANQMVDYMLNNPQPHQISSIDKLSFVDGMQFADFGPKLALNQSNNVSESEQAIDPVCFLKFPVLNDKLQEDHQSTLMVASDGVYEESSRGKWREGFEVDEDARVSQTTPAELRILSENAGNSPVTEVKNKRKRPRTTKTSEEVESQRMIHIAVERNRRKQMNEHLRVLRSLMPGSYVQRGDQASIIGGAIEFVRELEQLLQCLESQKRRRLYGDPPRPAGESSLPIPQPQAPPPPPFPLVALPNDQLKLVELETGLHEETAESKSCLADVEVKMVGFDAMIKILCRRRPGQLVKTIAALEDLQLSILHTNITTIEQTVLYSFNVKVGGEARFTAEDIASSVQQILNFINANSTM